MSSIIRMRFHFCLLFFLQFQARTEWVRPTSQEVYSFLYRLFVLGPEEKTFLAWLQEMHFCKILHHCGVNKNEQQKKKKNKIMPEHSWRKDYFYLRASVKHHSITLPADRIPLPKAGVFTVP